MKICKSIYCELAGQEQPEEAFHKLAASPDSLYSTCKKCVARRDRARSNVKRRANKRAEITDEQVKEARHLYKTTNLSISQLSQIFQINLNAVLYNKSHYDPTYIPPAKKVGRKNK